MTLTEKFSPEEIAPIILPNGGSGNGGNFEGPQGAEIIYFDFVNKKIIPPKKNIEEVAQTISDILKQTNNAQKIPELIDLKPTKEHIEFDKKNSLMYQLQNPEEFLKNNKLEKQINVFDVKLNIFLEFEQEISLKSEAEQLKQFKELDFEIGRIESTLYDFKLKHGDLPKKIQDNFFNLISRKNKRILEKQKIQEIQKFKKAKRLLFNIKHTWKQLKNQSPNCFEPIKIPQLDMSGKIIYVETEFNLWGKEVFKDNRKKNIITQKFRNFFPKKYGKQYLTRTLTDHSRNAMFKRLEDELSFIGQSFQDISNSIHDFPSIENLNTQYQKIKDEILSISQDIPYSKYNNI